MTSTRLLRLAGEIDYSSAPAFDALLQSLDDAQVVTLDFSGVTFFDSSALGCLIRLRDRMRAAGSDGTIQLLHPSATVRRILEVTGSTGSSWRSRTMRPRRTSRGRTSRSTSSGRRSSSTILNAALTPLPCSLTV